MFFLKRTLFPALIALILASSLSAKTYQVWVAIGQSLMDGPYLEEPILTGPENDGLLLEYKNGRRLQDFNTVGDVTVSYDRLSPAEVFARRLYAKGERDIVIIRISPGGHSITAFLAEDRREIPKKESNKDLWPTWVDFAKEKIDFLGSTGAEVNFRGIIMFQGSSDGNSTFGPYYETHLRRLIEDTRDYFAAPELNWLQVRSPYWTGGYWSEVIRNAQVSVAQATDHVAWTSSDNPLGEPLVYSDGTHPNYASSERIGYTWVDAWYRAFPTFRDFMLFEWGGDSPINLGNDTDHDGILDGVEYVLGGSPVVYERASDFYGVVSGAEIPIFWTIQNNLAMDVAVEFKVSEDLLRWGNAVEMDSTDSSQRWFTIEDAGSVDQLFFKVVVSNLAE